MWIFLKVKVKVQWFWKAEYHWLQHNVIHTIFATPT